MITKAEFMDEFTRATRTDEPVTKMVVAVKLPTGAIEIIINSDNITGKYQYYLDAYDNLMRLRNNPDVRVVGVLFV